MPTTDAASEKTGESEKAVPDFIERAESEKTAVSEEATTLMPARPAESDKTGESDDTDEDL